MRGWFCRSHTPRGIELWCRYDRTTGVYGEQGSGKTLDLLAPALLAHRGAALATLTGAMVALWALATIRHSMSPTTPEVIGTTR